MAIFGYFESAKIIRTRKN